MVYGKLRPGNPCTNDSSNQLGQNATKYDAIGGVRSYMHCSEAAAVASSHPVANRKTLHHPQEPEVHSVLQRCYGRIEIRPETTRTEIWLVSLDMWFLDTRTDRETDRHIDRLTDKHSHRSNNEVNANTKK